jgi:hypothetical protein
MDAMGGEGMMRLPLPHRLFLSLSPPCQLTAAWDRRASSSHSNTQSSVSGDRVMVTGRWLATRMTLWREKEGVRERETRGRENVARRKRGRRGCHPRSAPALALDAPVSLAGW